MTTHWNTRTIGGTGGIPGLDGKLMDEAVVILMQGKNTFGDRIYSYLKITLNDLKRMQAAVVAGAEQPLNPSDFGSVVAAGKGDPSDEIKAEVASMYKVIDPAKPVAPPPVAPAAAPKAWDDY